jgi:hypothetical protein
VSIFPFVFLAIWTSSFEKVLFSSVAHFFIGSLILGNFNFLSSLYILVTRPMSDEQLTNIFSCSLQFTDHFFCYAENLNVMSSHVPILSLSYWAAGYLLRKALPIPIVLRVFPALSVLIARF